MLKSLSRKVPIVAAILAGTLIAGEAEKPSQSLDEIVVSARGRESLVSQTPGSIGLLEGLEIRLQQPLSLTNTTTRIPGVDKSSDASWGSEINIRGLGRNRIVYLLDGSRVNTATDFAAQFGLILPNDIERVEVIKGPASALYGSGALGGVVNVITRGTDFTEEQELHGGLTLSWHSNPEGFGIYGWSSVSDENYYIFASGGRRVLDDYEDADGDEVRNSQFDDWQGRIRLGLKWDPANKTEIQFMHYQGHEIGIPGNGLNTPPGAADITYPDTNLSLLSLTHTITPDSEIWTESKIHLFAQRILRDVRIDNLPVPPSMPYPVKIAPSAVHTTFGAKWSNVFELDRHTLSWGADFWYWKYTGENLKYIQTPAGVQVFKSYPLADSNQYSAGIFMEDDWRLTDTLTLNIGARVDRIVAETEANPSSGTPEDTYHDISWDAHLGLTWQFAENWSATLLASSGYRAPDLLDRFKEITIGGVDVHGNRDLNPERSILLETGLHYTGTNLRASAAAFVNFVDDYIQREVIPGDPNGDERMENVAKAEFTGFEFDAEWHFAPAWSLYGNIAYVEAKDKTNNDYLRFTPPLNGLIGARYEHSSGLWTALELDWAADQNHSPKGTDNGEGWCTLNAQLGYDFTYGKTKQSLSLTLNNLANADYQNYLSTSRGFDLKEPGFNAIAAWTIEF